MLMSESGDVITGPGEGYLVFDRPWPGQMRTVYGDHKRFEETYFRKFPGYYTTGDGARRDADGYFWITGRIDDMMNVSGHLMSTAEVESALVEHPAVAEAAVVGRPHDVKGSCLYCFVSLKQGLEFTDALAVELKMKGIFRGHNGEIIWHDCLSLYVPARVGYHTTYKKLLCPSYKTSSLHKQNL